MIFLSRLLLDPRSKAVRRDLSDCREMHRTIMGAFPQLTTHDEHARANLGVLHRIEASGRSDQVRLYVQSGVEPEWAHLHPGYLAASGSMDNPACKPIGENYGRLVEGMRLRFRLRANPTKKVDTKTGPDGARRNGRRVELRREEDQMDWLARKATSCGFRLLDVAAASDAPDVRLTPEGLVRARKRESDHMLTFASVVFEGRLVVTDAQVFAEALKSGIGPGKAFGFGLLSVAADPG